MSATHTAVPNLVHIRPLGLQGEWVKYNQFLKKNLFIPFFRELTYRSDASTVFRAWWLNDAECAFLGFVDMASHVGRQIPKPPILGRD